MLPYLRNPSKCVQKLDRLPWADGISFEAYGARIGVRVSQPGATEDIRRLLPPGWRPTESAEVEELVSYQVGGAGPRRGMRLFHLVHADSLQVARTENREEALHAVESWAQLSVALHAKERVFIHAGAVGWRGRAIILPGRSFVGKSTLVAALLRAGATYLSDEYAVLDDGGCVHAYPRRLSLRNPDGAMRTRLTAEDLQSRNAPGPLPVGMVVIARYREGAAWRPRAVSPGRATLGLFDNAVAASRTPEQCLSAIRQVVAASVCVRGTRGEAPRTAERILAACNWAENQGRSIDP